jgi:hypothetical protein
MGLEAEGDGLDEEGEERASPTRGEYTALQQGGEQREWRLRPSCSCPTTGECEGRSGDEHQGPRGAEAHPRGPATFKESAGLSGG